MTDLHTMANTTRKKVRRRRVGRGIGSGVGKTCGRGEKGAGSRSGYRRRWGNEGGAMPLFMKTPIRGFSNQRFRKRFHTMNLVQINNAFSDGEVVDEESLRRHGLMSGKVYGIKILAKGDLTKKVSFSVHALSEKAKEKLQKESVPFTIIQTQKKT